MQAVAHIGQYNGHHVGVFSQVGQKEAYSRASEKTWG